MEPIDEERTEASLQQQGIAIGSLFSRRIYPCHTDLLGRAWSKTGPARVEAFRQEISAAVK